MSDYAKPQTTERERQPGLREEALRDILKKRHAYPHEVVAMATELLELRAILNLGPSAEEAPEEKVIYSQYHREQAKQAADHIGEFPWRGSKQGYAYWDKVYDNLREIATS